MYIYVPKSRQPGFFEANKIVLRPLEDRPQTRLVELLKKKFLLCNINVTDEGFMRSTHGSHASKYGVS